MPPYKLPEERRQSGMVSSSGAGADKFHELRFDDTPGSELLHMHSEKDMSVESEYDHRMTVGNDHSMQVAKDHDVQVGHNHRLHVAGTYSIHAGGGGGSGSGAGGGMLDKDTWKGGDAGVKGSNVMETIVDGNAFMCFLGGREEIRLGVQFNFWVSANFNVNWGFSRNYTGPYVWNVACGSVTNVEVAQTLGINAVGDLKTRVQALEATVNSAAAVANRRHVSMASVDLSAARLSVALSERRASLASEAVEPIRRRQNTVDSIVTVGSRSSVVGGSASDVNAGPRRSAVATPHQQNNGVLLISGPLIVSPPS
jgi:hypothetical protein